MKTILVVGIINILWVIWQCRNRVRFLDQKVQPTIAINQVIASTSHTGNLTAEHMFSSVEELSILKIFRVASHPRTAPKITQVD